MRLPIDVLFYMVDRHNSIIEDRLKRNTVSFYTDCNRFAIQENLEDVSTFSVRFQNREVFSEAQEGLVLVPNKIYELIEAAGEENTQDAEDEVQKYPWPISSAHIVPGRGCFFASYLFTETFPR